MPLSSVSARDPCAEALQRTQVRLPAWVPLLRVTPPLLPCFLSHSSAVLSIIKPEKAKKNHIIRKIYTRFRCEAVYRPALGPLHPNAVCPAYGHAHIFPLSLFWISPTHYRQTDWRTTRRPRSGGLLNMYLFLSIPFTVIPILPCQRHQQCGGIL